MRCCSCRYRGLGTVLLFALSLSARGQSRLEAQGELWAGGASNRFLLPYGLPAWNQTGSGYAGLAFAFAGVRSWNRGELRLGSGLTTMLYAGRWERLWRTSLELRGTWSPELGGWFSAGYIWSSQPELGHFAALEAGLRWMPTWRWGVELVTGWGLLPTVAEPRSSLRYGLRLLGQPHHRLQLALGWHGWGAFRAEPTTLMELTLGAPISPTRLRLDLEHQRWPVELVRPYWHGRRLVWMRIRNVDSWTSARLELAREVSASWEVALQMGLAQYRTRTQARAEALLGLALRASSLLWRQIPQGSVRYGTANGRVCVEVYYTGPGRLYLVGDFNGWQATAHPMEPDRGGWWRLCLSLPPGSYAFKIRCEGDPRYVWLPLPSNIERIPDGFGGENGRLWVEE
nr:MAG: hypothetical protein KatS3mg041_1425 [Bacteroidota bacterium]